MSLAITRRTTTIGLPIALGVGFAVAVEAAAPPLADIERRRGGRLGVFAVDSGSGRTLAYRADAVSDVQHIQGDSRGTSARARRYK